ncbi:MAG: hypothetical protein KF797_11675, partial [Flavobacteriales bacterium]|nr:hypothetical protein [Flavobacteriales bacterium]
MGFRALVVGSMLASPFMGMTQNSASATAAIRERLMDIRQWHEYPACGDSVYWNIVRLDKAAIAALIELIADTSSTSIHRPCTDKNLVVGDLAFKVLNEIVSLPLYQIAHMQFCVIGG